MNCAQCRRVLKSEADREAGRCANAKACRDRLERRVGAAVGRMRVLPFTAAQESSAYASAPKLGDR